MNLDDLIRDLREKRDSSREEIKAVERWRDEAKSNIEALQSIQDKFHNNTDSYQSFDKSKAWDVLESELEFDEIQESKVVNLARLYSVVASVAAIGILLLGFFYFNSLNGTGEEINFAAGTDIENFYLSDGSMVQLEPMSQFTMDKDIQDDRSGALNGSGLFQIRRDVARPFSITTNHAKVEVLGTVFNLFTNEDLTEISVVSGKVRIQDFNDSKPVILTNNESVIIRNNELQRSEFDRSEIKSKLRDLNFENRPLDEVFDLLELKFDVNLAFNSNEPMGNCYLTSAFNDESLEEILQEIKLVLGISYKIENNNVYISDFNCY